MPATRPAKPKTTRPGRPEKAVESCSVCKEPIVRGDRRGVQQMINGDAHADCARRFWDETLALIEQEARDGRHSLGFADRCAKCATWVVIDPHAKRDEGHRTYCHGCSPAAVAS